MTSRTHPRPRDARTRAHAGTRAFAIGTPIALAAAIAAAASLAGCRSTPAHAEPEPRPVRIDKVSTAPGTPAVRYSANIAPQSQVPVAFKVGGYIASILQRPGADKQSRDVQQGDVVKQGTVLAQVSPADYSARVEQSRAGVSGAQAGMVKAEADFDRASKLFATKSLTKPELDTARAALDSAKSRLDASQAEARLAEIALHDTQLTMPLNGIVLERRIERGALVAPGSVGFIVGNMRSVKAVFGVPDVIAPQMTLGTPVPIRTDAFPGRDFPGRVTAVSPAADPQSRVFSIEVTVPNGDNALRPGMVATVEVKQSASARAGAAASAPSVPLAAVVKRPGSSTDYAVFVVEESAGKGGTGATGADKTAGGGPESGTTAGSRTIARVRPIVLGDVAGNTVVVTSGVRIGERVITSGATLVHDGEAVRIVP